MSCNGCRVLRKGCNDACVLRPCLQWIDSAAAQGHATLFVAKFFGRAGLLSFISAAPDHQRHALFQSLLFEACGRTINPIGGAVGLLSTGNWHLCQAAVDAVLRGDALRPLPGLPQAAISPLATLSDGTGSRNDLNLYLFRRDTADRREAGRPATPSIQSDGSVTTTSGESLTGDDRKLLDLFV